MNVVPECLLPDPPRTQPYGASTYTPSREWKLIGKGTSQQPSSPLKFVFYLCLVGETSHLVPQEQWEES